MRELRYLSGVSTISLDAGRCVGCGLCETVCPHGVLALDGDRAGIVDRDGWLDCGACLADGPAGAGGVTPGVGGAAKGAVDQRRGVGYGVEAHPRPAADAGPLAHGPGQAVGVAGHGEGAAALDVDLILSLFEDGVFHAVSLSGRLGGPDAGGLVQGACHEANMPG